MLSNTLNIRYPHKKILQQLKSTDLIQEDQMVLSINCNKLPGMISQFNNLKARLT